MKEKSCNAALLSFYSILYSFFTYENCV